MTDPIPTSQQPIVITASAKIEMIVTAVRQIALIVGGTITFVGFVRTHDIAGLIAWLRSNDFALVATAIGTGGVMVWGQYVTWRRKREAVTLAEHVPDRVAIVTGKSA